MKKVVKHVCIIVVLVITISASCVIGIKLAVEYERVCGIYKEGYDNVLIGFGKESIQQTVDKTNVKAEYRVVYEVSFLLTDYYSLQVLADGTGIFTFMVRNSDRFDKGEIVLNVSKAISKEETNELLKALRNNRFYLIPTIQPVEWLGFIYWDDGSTVSIEGYDGSRTHFITMWEPDRKYGISKIHKAFADFADTIVERPDISYFDESNDAVDNVFKIVKDTRAVKADLTGRYVVENNTNVFFEIFNDHVVLCDYLMIYDRFTNERSEKTVEISSYIDASGYNEVTEIVFISMEDQGIPKKMILYLEGTDTLVWEGFYGPESRLAFIKQFRKNGW